MKAGALFCAVAPPLRDFVPTRPASRATLPAEGGGRTLRSNRKSGFQFAAPPSGQPSRTRQISSAYSRIARSEENHAIRAVLRIALAHQPRGSRHAASIDRCTRQ